MKKSNVVIILALVLLFSVCFNAQADSCKHVWESPTNKDSTYHTMTCKYCGITMDFEHEAPCTDTSGVCSVCGASGVTVVYQHHYTDYDYDDIDHWLVCKDDPSHITSKEHHTVDASGSCFCGATGLRTLITSIKLNTNSKIMELGSGAKPTFQLTATTLPANTSPSDIRYTSSNLKVATVNNTTGLITGVGEGTCTITAKAIDGGNASATCSVKIKYKKVSQITLAAEEKELRLIDDVDVEYELNPTIVPSDAYDKSIQYTSSNTSVATVSKNGKVLAIAPGIATITATAKDGSGVTATCKIIVSDGSVQEITLNAYSRELVLHEGVTSTFKLVTTVRPSDATNKSLLFTSTNPTIATVSNTGLITAKKPGSCIINVEARDGSGVKATCAITVKNEPVTDILLNTNKKIMEITNTSKPGFQLTATVVPSTATNRKVTWTSDDVSVATVDNYGYIQSVGVGTCTITCEAQDGSGVTATCTVKIKPTMVSEIVLNAKSKILVQKENSDTTFQLTATVKPSNAFNSKINWTSSDPLVATVDNTGLITCLSPGNTTITAAATDGSGIKAECTVKVKTLNVTSVTLNTSSKIMAMTNANQYPTFQLKATVLPEDASVKTVLYKSSDESIASVSEKGLIKAVGPGTCTVTATSASDPSIKATCSVKIKKSDVSAITLNATSKIMELPKPTFQLKATVMPTDAFNRSVSYTSSNTKVATVSSTGLITGVGIGTCVITVEAKDGSGVTATCNVKIKNKQITGITLNSTSKIFELQKGKTQTYQLKATIKPDNATNKTLEYSSSDTSVATVNEKGLITLVGKGTCTITAAAKDGSGITATCSVKVKKIAVTGITLNTTKKIMELGPGTPPTFQLKVTLSPSNPYSKAVKYSTSDPSVASVSSSGLITATGYGTCTVTVASEEDSSVYATCSVKIKPAP